MKKVLLLAPDFNQYTEMFCKSIQNCGYQVKGLSFKAYNWKTALFKLLHLDENIVVEKRRSHFNELARAVYKEYAPDYVIVIRGDFMQYQTLEQMKKSRLALWLYDSLKRYPETGKNWEMYDLHYVFEASDIEQLEKENKQVEFLPLGYDSERYTEITDVEKTVDISFVGAMYGNRKKLLEQLAMDFSDLNLEFYGVYAYKRHIAEYIKFCFSPYKKFFKNKLISHEEANQLYARSKINLNILHEQSQSGWNARLNEILGAKGFELITNNPLITEKYKGMLVTYADYEDLKGKIRYYLENTDLRETIAEQGYKWVLDNETYDSRFKYILEQLESLEKK